MPDNTAERPRVYLNSVHLKGYKSIEDLTIDFQKGLNILIGKNGAGKSNFLEFIDQRLTSKSNTKNLYKSAKLEFHSDNGHSYIFENERELHVKTGKEHLSDKFAISERFTKDGEIIYNGFNENITFKDDLLYYSGNPVDFFNNWASQQINSDYIKYTLPNNLGCIDLPGTLKAQWDGLIFWDFPDTLGFINRIFRDLEEFFDDQTNNKLYDLNTTNLRDHLKIQDNILENLKLYTSIEDVRFNSNINLYRDEKSIIVENVRLDFKINGNWLPWSQLSDGTRRLFYIISEVTYNKGIVLIEEPELGIHPHQFNLLMDFLKEQSEDKQIIISTHSPKALDHLSEDELGNILIAYYDLDKGTQIRHLTEKEEKKAKRYMKEVGFFSDYWMLSDLE